MIKKDKFNNNFVNFSLFTIIFLAPAILNYFLGNSSGFFQMNYFSFLLQYVIMFLVSVLVIFIDYNCRNKKKYPSWEIYSKKTKKSSFRLLLVFVFSILGSYIFLEGSLLYAICCTIIFMLFIFYPLCIFNIIICSYKLSE